MQVRDMMKKAVVAIATPDTIAHAARQMARLDVGCLPVLRDGKVAGIVTDRDIVVRGLANGIRPDIEIVRIMTERVFTCMPDEDIKSVVTRMLLKRVRRLPVCVDGGELVGIIALADVTDERHRKNGVVAIRRARAPRENVSSLSVSKMADSACVGSFEFDAFVGSR